MPKKQINYPAAERHVLCSKQDGEHAETTTVHWDPVVTVHWDKGNPDWYDRNGHVFLGISEFPSMTEAEFDAVTDVNPLAEEKVKTRNLSRTDLNRLIAALRKARDEAYGRDE